MNTCPNEIKKHFSAHGMRDWGKDCNGQASQAVE